MGLTEINLIWLFYCKRAVNMNSSNGFLWFVQFLGSAQFRAKESSVLHFAGYSQSGQLKANSSTFNCHRNFTSCPPSLVRFYDGPQHRGGDGGGDRQVQAGGDQILHQPVPGDPRHLLPVRLPVPHSLHTGPGHLNNVSDLYGSKMSLLHVSGCICLLNTLFTVKWPIMSSNTERQIAPGQAVGKNKPFGHFNWLKCMKWWINISVADYISNAECIGIAARPREINVNSADEINIQQTITFPFCIQRKSFNLQTI